MKKMLWIVVMIVFVVILGGCSGGSEEENVEIKEIQKYSVYLDISFDENILMNRYDVDVKFMRNIVGSIPHGENFTLLIDEVPEGDHDLIFYKAEENSVDGNVRVSVKGDTTFKCVIHAKGSEVKINNSETVMGIQGTSMKVTELVGMNLQLALDDLDKTGFVNVVVEGEDDASIWDKTNWTILTQSVLAGSEIDKNDELILTCVKTKDYISRALTGLTVEEGKEKVAVLGYSGAAFIDTKTQNDVSTIVNEMSTEEGMDWKISEARISSSDESILEIKIKYAAAIEVPDLVGIALQDAVVLLEDIQIYNIEMRTSDDSKIYSEEDWTVVKQSLAPGSTMNADDSIRLVCMSTIELEEAERVEKNKVLEASFPVEYAKRAVVVALTNSLAIDVFDESGNSLDASKFHSYDDVSGNFFDYYIAVKDEGIWTATDDGIWHVESMILQNSIGVEANASMKVRKNEDIYVVHDIEGIFGSGDLKNMMELYSEAELYLNVPYELIMDDRPHDNLDNYHSWAENQFSIWDGSHEVLEDLIISNLNDEKSYDHINTFYTHVTNEEYRDDINTMLKNAGFSDRVEIGDLWIQVEFTAKNAFNATIKSNAFGYVSFADNMVHLISIE